MYVRLAALLLLLPSTLFAQGFGFREQTARALGVAGAFTAHVNDPTAAWYNPGALGLLTKKKGVALGAMTGAFNESLYQGLPPGVGAGTTAEQETPLQTTPHAFLTLPFGSQAVAALGFYSPLQLRTEWADPDLFAGRFTATESKIETYDVSTGGGIRLGRTVGLGAMFVARHSTISASRRVGATLGGARRDIGGLVMETDTERALGFIAGFLHRPSDRFAWGVTYRSDFDTEYIGVGRLTQISTGDAQFDQLVRATFPFDQDLALASRLQFPAQATLGIAMGIAKPLLLEVDVTQTGWDDFDQLPLTFPSNATLDSRYALAFEDTLSYRAGLRFTFPTGPQIRVGYAYDESPQPDATVGAFLPESGHSTLTAGFGLDWLDVAVAWTTYDQRIVSTSLEGLNGNYRASAWTVAITATK